MGREGGKKCRQGERREEERRGRKEIEGGREGEREKGDH